MSSNVYQQKIYMLKLIPLTSDTTPPIKRPQHSIKI